MWVKSGQSHIGTIRAKTFGIYIFKILAGPDGLTYLGPLRERNRNIHKGSLWIALVGKLLEKPILEKYWTEHVGNIYLMYRRAQIGYPIWGPQEKNNRQTQKGSFWVRSCG